MVLWVVLLFGMYVRTVKVPSSNGTVNEYLRVVEAYRENGKVKQRIIADLGRRDMLSALLPNLRRILEGTPKLEGQQENDVDILNTFTWGPLLVAGKLFEELGLWDLLDRLLGKSDSPLGGSGICADRKQVDPPLKRARAGRLAGDGLLLRSRGQALCASMAPAGPSARA